jgi:RNA polymerase sigma factor (TIGR02999 family)
MEFTIGNKAAIAPYSAAPMVTGRAMRRPCRRDPATTMTAESDIVARLLNEIPHRPSAASELLPLVYDQLRAIAQQRMREERVGHTLQATALVHEAYVRLAKPGAAAAGNAATIGGWEGQHHFFRVAAEAMRKILIDHARRRSAEKRGGGKRPVTLTGANELSIDGDPESALALEEALTALQKEDSRAAEVVQLRFFAGLGFGEIAKLLNVSERTIMREWAFARARLVQLIEGEGHQNIDPAEAAN